ncbi:MAG TPA: DUF2339 domain-containing protein [Candidatus Acidoferrum sp.]|nr:DUF2339 domain-containing protein [Candidatus Acidoferrum sp.]
MEALIALVVIAVLAGPILAIIALVSVRRLEGNNLAFGTSQLRDLTTRVFALERQLRELTGVPPAPGTPAVPEPAARPKTPLRAEIPAALPPQPFPEQPIPPSSASSPPPPITAAPASHPVLRPIPPAASTSAPDLESLIGGRWLNRIGIVAMLIAVSYFLKLAFDNNWIGPTGRVAIGILLGALMLPWSHWLLGRGYSYFSEGIAALGEATLFLSVWAGCQYYTLYSRDVGFAAMIFITAVMAAIAIGRDSQRLAVLSLLGGLLAPILASSGKDQQVILFSYLLLLGLGALVVAAKKEWNALPPIAFIGTQIYFWGWYSGFFHRASPLERTVFFASLFFLLYSLWPIRKAVRSIRISELDFLFVLLNEFAYSGALFVLLWPGDKWPMTLLFIALAAAHVAVARLLPPLDEKSSATFRLLLAGLALTYVTLAIPVRLEGKWITFSFAVEGAILVWTGFRTTGNFLRQAGYLLLAISALRLLFFPPDGGAFLFNSRFAAFLIMIACFALALWAARSHADEVGDTERIEVGLFAVAINVYALVALSSEFWDYFGRVSLDNQFNARVDAALGQHLALTILWTVYATALIVVGVQKKSALLRWQGLALIGLVVGKVFLYDLSSLDRAYRILSFFVLGAVLLGVSFLYQRRLARERAS